MHEYLQVFNIPNLRKRIKGDNKLSKQFQRYGYEGKKKQIGKEVEMAWQEHQLGNGSAKETSSWVPFKSPFLFQEAVDGSEAFLQPTACQVRPKGLWLYSALQHFYCGSFLHFVQEDNSRFVSGVMDNQLPDFFSSCMDAERCLRIENHTFLSWKFMEE